MIEVKGKYAKAIVYTDNIEPEAISQIIELCNQEFTTGAKIRIMPDCHVGSGCVIGFTGLLGEKVIPNIVGVDIGCGMLTVGLGKINITLEELDNKIHDYIPAGFNVHEGRVMPFKALQNLHCYRDLKDTSRIERSIGTLGGGNHFIELSKDSNDNIYLIIHTGSRNLGKQVAEYYQKLAIELCSGKDEFYDEKELLIYKFKKAGRKDEIQKELKLLKEKYFHLSPKYPKDLCFLTDNYREMYLHDMRICQEFASLNRYKIAEKLIIWSTGDNLPLCNNSKYDYFETIHNYISFADNIVRKGSISAYRDEKLLIPINMRDGSILGIGKGNSAWNYSAPHGAGRLMSRSKAKENLTLEDYENTMEGIFSTTIKQSTLDEAPMAYKSIEEIINNIGDTVKIIDILKPIYNFKSS
jgi:RNA-splicing ligase RtcB